MGRRDVAGAHEEDENHVGRASTPAAGLQTRLFPNRLRWVFDRPRVLQDPLFPCETAPLAGLEKTRRTGRKPTIRIDPRGAGTLPAALPLLAAGSPVRLS